MVGGAGYIGNIIARHLRQAGHDIIVLDNLSLGHREGITDGMTLIEGDLLERNVLAETFSRHEIDAVLHFAARSLVGESTKDPDGYYENNVVGTLRLLQAMHVAKVDKIVFSSSAAVYGEPEQVPITEEARTSPTNPYGQTKVAIEGMLHDFGRAYGLRYVSLRYFNAAGAGLGWGEWHEHETHLIPLVLATALKERDEIVIFGDDYDTPDGSCIRDYIDILDLAEAHALAVDRLLAGGESLVCNLGTSKGSSVKEVIDMCKEVSGVDFPVRIGKRRAGDPARLVASKEKAKQELGWSPKRSLRDTIESAWAWQQELNSRKNIRA